MEFRIADTFTASLDRLKGAEQKAVKTTAFDLQMNPAHPGLRFHRIDAAKDPHFWSVSVNLDIRLIVHKTAASLLLCYVDHHDDAYRWAERRKIERHPRTGAAQLVEIRETIREITVPRVVEAKLPAERQLPLFPTVPEEVLLGYGVPTEWLADVREATEDSLFDLAEHLPTEAAEALLDLATGTTPRQPARLADGADPFEHPDAQRRFRVMANHEELARALEFPWEKWTVFLHPDQRQLVERDFSGPARIAGTAGTGKTIVALHRAVHLSRTDRKSRVLLATFSEPLARALRTRLRSLIGNEPRIAERLEVQSMKEVGRRLYRARFGSPKVATATQVQKLLNEAAANVEDHGFSAHFLWDEWNNAVDAWQLESWETYRDVLRLGRKTRLVESRRAILWSIFERVRSALEEQKLVTEATLFGRLARQVKESKRLPFDYAVIDEAQDIAVAELRFLAALAGERPNALFFAGDLGQRIFQQPFSWKSLGVDVRGRSSTLRINYRTSHQIRSQADHLLAPQLSDVDGNVESRQGAISIFNGPPPSILIAANPDEESRSVADWIRDRLLEVASPHELAVFVRSSAELPRATAAAEAAGVPSIILDGRGEPKPGHLSITTMHLAKGLEFRAVVVMACDDEVVPLQERLESVADESDLEEVYQTERHLLYVACTRARDRLLVTGVSPGSEFLEDMAPKARAQKTTDAPRSTARHAVQQDVAHP